MIGVDADDDAIGLHEIFDRRAFLQKLGIGADVKGGRRVARDLRAYLFGRPDRDRALGNDQLRLVHVLADGAGNAQHVLEIGRAVLVGRRADGDEDDL